MDSKKVLIYRTHADREPFIEWLEKLDKNTQIKIRKRISRIEIGNLGDYKLILSELYELRLFFGAGYRVYFGMHDGTVIILLCGGDKSSQKKILKKPLIIGERHKMRSFHEYNIEKLRDPKDASLYLTEALASFEEDNDSENFLKALKNVTDAQGGIGELAQKTNLNRQNLYKLLSAKRQPKIETLGTILDGLGFRLSIVPKNIVPQKHL